LPCLRQVANRTSRERLTSSPEAKLPGQLASSKYILLRADANYSYS